MAKIIWIAFCFVFSPLKIHEKVIPQPSFIYKRTLHVNVIIVTVFWHKAESIWSQPLLLSLKVNLVCTQVILASSVGNKYITINMWCKITFRRRGGWSDSLKRMVRVYDKWCKWNIGPCIIFCDLDFIQAYQLSIGLKSNQVQSVIFLVYPFQHLPKKGKA